jgi:hypothetical protein
MGFRNSDTANHRARGLACEDFCRIADLIEVFHFWTLEGCQCSSDALRKFGFLSLRKQ